MTTQTRTYEAVDVRALGDDPEKFVGRRVDVYGASYTRAGLSKPYVVATAVEPGP